MAVDTLGELVWWEAPDFAVNPALLAEVFHLYNINAYTPPKPGIRAVLMHAAKEYASETDRVIYAGKTHRLTNVTIMRDHIDAESGRVESELIEAITYDRHTGKLSFREEGDPYLVRSIVNRVRARIHVLDYRDFARIMARYLMKECHGVMAERGTYIIPLEQLPFMDRMEFALNELKLKTPLHIGRISIANTECSVRSIERFIKRHVAHQLARAERRKKQGLEERLITSARYSPGMPFYKGISEVNALLEQLRRWKRAYPLAFTEETAQAEHMITSLTEAIEVCRKKREKVQREGRVEKLRRSY